MTARGLQDPQGTCHCPCPQEHPMWGAIRSSWLQGPWHLCGSDLVSNISCQSWGLAAGVQVTLGTLCRWPCGPGHTVLVSRWPWCVSSGGSSRATSTSPCCPSQDGGTRVQVHPSRGNNPTPRCRLWGSCVLKQVNSSRFGDLKVFCRHPALWNALSHLSSLCRSFSDAAFFSILFLEAKVALLQGNVG